MRTSCLHPAHDVFCGKFLAVKLTTPRIMPFIRANCGLSEAMHDLQSIARVSAQLHAKGNRHRNVMFIR